MKLTGNSQTKRLSSPAETAASAWPLPSFSCRRRQVAIPAGTKRRWMKTVAQLDPTPRLSRRRYRGGTASGSSRILAGILASWTSSFPNARHLGRTPTGSTDEAIF